MNFNILPSRSLKTRVITLTLIIFLISIWSVTYYAQHTLREDMQHLLSDQQQSTCPPRLLTTELCSLRALMDDRVELWIGGACTHRVSARMNGITFMASIDAAVQTHKTKLGHDLGLVGSENDEYHG